MSAKRIPKWPWMRHGKVVFPAMWWEELRSFAERFELRRCVVANGEIMLTCQYAPWLHDRPWERPGHGSGMRTLWRADRGAWRRVGERWTLRGVFEDIAVADIGPMTVQARYVDLVERLYPGCRWKVPKLGTGPARAHQDGRAVAAIMPMATDRYLRVTGYPRFPVGAAARPRRPYPLGGLGGRA